MVSKTININLKKAPNTIRSGKSRNPIPTSIASAAKNINPTKKVFTSPPGVNFMVS